MSNFLKIWTLNLKLELIGDEDEPYLASCAEAPHIHAHGGNPIEALTRCLEAIDYDHASAIQPNPGRYWLTCPNPQSVWGPYQSQEAALEHACRLLRSDKGYASFFLEEGRSQFIAEIRRPC